ncbi:23S rRNA (pseudouridine(1915)-N(3))-methyltransferase RlmH [Sulfurovum mangrovi]|uniref:23S rRNA (pseudouridine(1915)-N(3))-methyltransferase RlmH n=1 Tax=Sulfurovum mangrovi TaxID=2893889 RepID=UPI001E5F1201|nr:23S rRNA (pseudouridine(1915)-N(3))-methyltransferase RlmH [Sulfurovum mangrovi]UFH60143.1 23S rRNA (pseudouridine(1915)-N(3))-methyltransferase RlmH [Sulfurovum mangrovi]
MKINVIIVDKKGKEPLYAPLIEHYKKIAKPFAKVEVIEVFDKEIARAHDISPDAAQKSYTKALEKYLGSGYNVALDPSSKEVDSHNFADLLKDKSEVNLYIGGAYGFESAFLNKCNKAISFGKITLSHKLVKVVLLEQIFRGLAINHNHPYHK